MAKQGKTKDNQAMSAQQQREASAPRKGDVKSDWLGSQLRALYDTYANEPVPDDLQALLNRLDEAGEPAADAKPKGRSS